MITTCEHCGQPMDHASTPSDYFCGEQCQRHWNLRNAGENPEDHVTAFFGAAWGLSARG